MQDAVTWNGADCYIIGERGDDLLLFCPRLQPPRNRVVKNNATGLERTGIKESIFTAFSSDGASRSPNAAASRRSRETRWARGPATVS